MRRWFGGLAVRWFGMGAVAVIALVGCKGGEQPADDVAAAPAKPLVVFAQANSQDPWRQVFDGEIRATAAEHSTDFDFELQDAQDDANKQIGVIDTFLVKSPKVLIVSPCDVSVTQAVGKAFDKGVPVITLDRQINSDKFTCWIGGDNVEIGRTAGDLMGKMLGGKGTVLMIQGLAIATPTEERREGFMEAIANYPGVRVITGDFCDYRRDRARSYMETFLQSGKQFDAVYAHNDEMAIGAYLALEAKGVVGKRIFGIDACQQEVIDMIKEGKLAATFSYPTPGAKAIEIAVEILKGKMPAEKRYVLPTETVTIDNADAYASAHPSLVK